MNTKDIVLDTRQSDLRIYQNYFPTLRTGRHGLLYVKDNKLRKLSGKEALFLQGFSKKQLCKLSEISNTILLSQAGNSFTVNVIQSIAERLLRNQTDLIFNKKKALVSHE